MNEIFHRTSVRNYLDRQIEQEKAEQMLLSLLSLVTEQLAKCQNMLR